MQFEAKMKWGDLYSMLPTKHKPGKYDAWKMTDYNNVMNGNPYLKLI